MVSEGNDTYVNVDNYVELVDFSIFLLKKMTRPMTALFSRESCYLQGFNHVMLVEAGSL